MTPGHAIIRERQNREKRIAELEAKVVRLTRQRDKLITIVEAVMAMAPIVLEDIDAEGDICER